MDIISQWLTSQLQHMLTPETYAQLLTIGAVATGIVAVLRTMVKTENKPAIIGMATGVSALLVAYVFASSHILDGQHVIAYLMATALNTVIAIGVHQTGQNIVLPVLVQIQSLGKPPEDKKEPP